LGPVGARLGTSSGPASDAARTPLRPVAQAETAPSIADLDGDFVPAHRFDQAFTVAHPPDTVFALLGDVEAVAACLPGAMLTGQPTPDAVEGALQVRIGPIAARFRGRARIFRDEAVRTGRILGAGSDAGGRSATQGEIRYRVGPGEIPGTARIDLAVGYTLQGPLAQFGRPGLVRDLAGRLGADFAANLEARLSGAPVPAATGLNPLRLLLTMLTTSLRRRLAAWGRRP
ncbi:SRPBCC family protein, partial [Methylobacterium sp. WL19]|uniref:SRPBCC family protein n=1 Tax=Methylobacterium sp. WL19 TaxID=2603896 RepID=UPI0011D58542